MHTHHVQHSAINVLQNALSQTLNTPFFNAEAAYNLREKAMPKRQKNLHIQTYILERNAADRTEVEAFIARVFAKAYGANVQLFMPQLVALRDENNALVAAFGLRKATTEPLFLEQYLDVPIEQLLSASLSIATSRTQITEIGNLAVENPRNAGALIAAVIDYSLTSGVQWCVCTAHHTLQNALIKGGREVTALQMADKNRLSPQALATWGTYYQNNPQIVAVRGVI